MSKTLDRLADLAAKDPAAALARLEEHRSKSRAKARRVSVKRTPRRQAERVKRQTRRERVASIRAEVFKRADGTCEACGNGPPTDMHHVLGGADRRPSEAVETCAALCAFCHGHAHRSTPFTLALLERWAARHNYLKAHAGILRRLAKLNEARR